MLFRQEIIETLLLEAIISSVIVFISLRVYLLGHGYFDYADQYWYPTVHRAGLVSFNPAFEGGYVSILYFTRSLIGGIGVFLSWLSSNPMMQEKIFLVYTFILFLVFSYVFAEILYRLVDKFLVLKFGFLKKEALKAFIVVAIYSNIAIMNLNVDGGTWADGLIMLFIVISIAVSILIENKLVVLSAVSSLLSISILLDPDYYLVFVLIVLVVSLVNYRRSLLQRIVLPLAEVAISVPIVLYIVEGMLITSSGIGNPLAGRSLFSIIPAISQNPISPILLIRYFWSTYSISPPSIYLFIGKNVILPGFGNMVVLPNSWITTLWIVTLAAYPVLALGSLIFRRSRKIALPFIAMWLVGYVLSTWWQIPGIKELGVSLSNISFIGSAIATTLSNPEHYQNILGISEVALLGIFLSNLVSSKLDVYAFVRKGGYIVLLCAGVIFVIVSWFSIRNISSIPLPKIALSEYLLVLMIVILTFLLYLFTKKNTISSIKKIFLNRRFRNWTKRFLVFSIVFVVIFTGWQAFNGSFYPERSWTGNTVGLLENPGAFQPWDLPNYVTEAYDALTSNSSYYTVLYYPGYNNFPYDYSWLSFLIQGNYYSDILPFLEAENIKYIITYIEGPQTTNVLNESGLANHFLGPSSYLYVNNYLKGFPYQANLLLNYSSNNENYLLSYRQFQSLNIVPVFSNNGTNTFGFNNLADRINMLTPHYFLLLFPSRYEASMSGAFNGSKTISLIPNSPSSLGDGWYLYDGTSPTTVKSTDGSIYWNATPGGEFAINFGNSTYNGSLFSPINNYLNVSLTGNITFSYSASSTFNGEIKVSFLYITQTQNSSIMEQYFSVPQTFNSSRVNSNNSYSFDFPNNTRYITPYLLVNGSAGNVDIKNVSFVLKSSVILNTSSSSVAPVSTDNSSFILEKQGNYYIRVEGIGALNGIRIDSNHGVWLDLAGGLLNFTGSLKLESVIFTNNYTLKEMMGNYTVYDYPYSYEARLKQNGSIYLPSLTLTGHEFFNAPLSEDGKIILLNLNFISYGYVSIVIFVTLFPLFTLVINPQIRKFKIKRKERKTN